MSLVYFDGMDQYMNVAAPTTTTAVWRSATPTNLTTVSSDPAPFFMDATKNMFARIAGDPDRVWRVPGYNTTSTAGTGSIGYEQNRLSAPYSSVRGNGFGIPFNFLRPVSETVHITAGFKMKVAINGARTNPATSFSATSGFLLAAFSTDPDFATPASTFGIVIGDAGRLYVRQLLAADPGGGVGYVISPAFAANTFTDVDASGFIGTSNFVFGDCSPSTPSPTLDVLAANTVEVQYTAAGKISVWINNMFAGTATFANPAPFTGTKYIKTGCWIQLSSWGNGSTQYGFIGITDVYLLNGLGTRNNNRLGKVKVVSRVPVADAGVQFVRPDTSNSNASVVSQTPALVTPSLVGTRAGDTDLYSSAAFNFTNEAILGTAVFTTGYKTDPSGNDIAPVLNVTGTSYTGSTNTLPISSSLMKTDIHIYELNPKTGQPFTKTELDATTFGVTVVAPPV